MSSGIGGLYNIIILDEWPFILEETLISVYHQASSSTDQDTKGFHVGTNYNKLLVAERRRK